MLGSVQARDLWSLEQAPTTRGDQLFKLTERYGWCWLARLQSQATPEMCQPVTVPSPPNHEFSETPTVDFAPLFNPAESSNTASGRETGETEFGSSAILLVHGLRPGGGKTRKPGPRRTESWTNLKSRSKLHCCGAASLSMSFVPAHWSQASETKEPLEKQLEAATVRPRSTVAAIRHQMFSLRALHGQSRCTVLLPPNHTALRVQALPNPSMNLPTSFRVLGFSADMYGAKRDLPLQDEEPAREIRKTYTDSSRENSIIVSRLDMDLLPTTIYSMYNIPLIETMYTRTSTPCTKSFACLINCDDEVNASLHALRYNVARLNEDNKLWARYVALFS
ncbi:uncharacterized protein MYCFIDRAFT_174719 [Pseudocercospora fijiensis CIRAD86]|uniref:Uncharacterized protein n=1 Tax=Pseudocercospora fijiensis (strain CIRAD86) TaxID=383855 RepID=M3B1N0_PSEFD|nr:uncharacterized protein MYCFIDRAFT_174719 [Pseudocercospora fijiensis CIRAD86]EME83253.1 hypothetical protein MYCFIDRAFT_174719 [Pseudocercospora fijiensis CIRAD86]